MNVRVAVLAVAVAGSWVGSSTVAPPRAPDTRGGQGGVSVAPVLPGVTVLLRDSLALVTGKRVGLVTNQTGINERGESTADLLYARLRSPGPGLVALFSPEHGIRGTEDRANIENERDVRTGLPVYSLYTTEAVPPADSLLRRLDVLVIDLFDIGTRTWTYVGTMLYAMRAAARVGIPVIVLDRPNPLGGARVDGPLLDSALANPDDPAPGRGGRAYALYPMPLRHGLTIGELAKWLNAELRLNAALHVIPMEGWRRAMWWDETGIPWVRPSPNIPSLMSATVYPALVAFERANLSVGRGTPEPFQRFGAPWMNGDSVAALLNSRGLAGVRFVSETFTPKGPTDQKYPETRLRGVRVVVTDRTRLQVGRVGAAILWAVHAAHRDSLVLSGLAFDLRFGAPAVRSRITQGDDPDEVIDRHVAAVAAWERRTRPFHLYR